MRSSNSATWLNSLYPTRAAREFIARAYRSAFGGKAGGTVLADLQKACFILDTTTYTKGRGAIDPYQMAVNEGRRQAYMHIAGMLSVTGEDLKPMEQPDDDQRDERRNPDDRDGGHGGRGTARWGGDYDPALDGPNPAPGNATSDAASGDEPAD